MSFQHIPRELLNNVRWAGGMDREPKLPPSFINPEQVAEAILKAATGGGRDVKVGAMAVVSYSGVQAD